MSNFREPRRTVAGCTFAIAVMLEAAAIAGKPPDHVITGRIVDEQGMPICSGSVLLLPRTVGGCITYGSVVDDLGRFRIDIPFYVDICDWYLVTTRFCAAPDAGEGRSERWMEVPGERLEVPVPGCLPEGEAFLGDVRLLHDLQAVRLHALERNGKVVEQVQNLWLKVRNASGVVVHHSTFALADLGRGFLGLALEPGRFKLELRLGDDVAEGWVDVHRTDAPIDVVLQLGDRAIRHAAALDREAARTELARRAAAFDASSLRRAIEEEDLELVELFLMAGMSPDSDVSDGSSPSDRLPALLVALGLEHDDISLLLLERGASADARDGGGLSALMIASGARRPSLVRRLVELGADVNAVDGSGMSALAAGIEDPETRKLLLAAGADPRVAGDDGEPLIMTADDDAIEDLVAYGASHQVTDTRGRSMLHLALLRHGHPGEVQRLLDHGLDPDALDRDGVTPVTHALSMLLELEAWGRHPVTDAARLVVQASRKGLRPIDRLLMAVAADDEAAVQAAASSADVDARDLGGRTPLMGAVEAGKRRAFEALIRAGADVDLADDAGETALYLAAGDADAASVRRLIEVGADVDAAGEHGETPLLWVVGGVLQRDPEMEEIVNLLVAGGADLAATGPWGDVRRTALIHGYEEMLERAIARR